jgi:hypothetical protein
MSIRGKRYRESSLPGNQNNAQQIGDGSRALLLALLQLPSFMFLATCPTHLNYTQFNAHEDLKVRPRPRLLTNSQRMIIYKSF